MIYADAELPAKLEHLLAQNDRLREQYRKLEKRLEETVALAEELKRLIASQKYVLIRGEKFILLDGAGDVVGVEARGS